MLNLQRVPRILKTWIKNYFEDDCILDTTKMLFLWGTDEKIIEFYNWMGLEDFRVVSVQFFIDI